METAPFSKYQDVLLSSISAGAAPLSRNTSVTLGEHFIGSV